MVLLEFIFGWPFVRPMLSDYCLSACLSCLSVKVGLSPGDSVLDGDPAPPFQKRRRSPQFSAHVYCGQTAGWVKMALGMEVGFGPVHIVPDGDTAPLPKKRAEPQFSAPSLLWPNGWMHENATWYGGRPQLRRLCVRWGPSSVPVWLTPATRMPCNKAAKTRNPSKFAGVPKTPERISAVSEPEFTIFWGHVGQVLLFNKCFFDCWYMP